METPSKDECPSCKGRLEYEGCYLRFYGGFRFDRYRCVVCRQTVEIRIDEPIEKTFPMIREVTIEVLEEGTRNPRTYNKSSNSGLLFCCSNPKCTNPGIFIEPILREMVEKRQSHRKTWSVCNGFEPSPKWRRKKPCNRSFKITIDLTLDQKV
jgi:hypothetical protein